MFYSFFPVRSIDSKVQIISINAKYVNESMNLIKIKRHLIVESLKFVILSKNANEKPSFAKPSIRVRDVRPAKPFQGRRNIILSACGKTKISVGKAGPFTQ